MSDSKHVFKTPFNLLVVLEFWGIYETRMEVIKFFHSQCEFKFKVELIYIGQSFWVFSLKI